MENSLLPTIAIIGVFIAISDAITFVKLINERSKSCCGGMLPKKNAVYCCNFVFKIFRFFTNFIKQKLRFFKSLRSFQFYAADSSVIAVAFLKLFFVKTFANKELLKEIYLAKEEISAYLNIIKTIKALKAVK